MVQFEVYTVFGRIVRVFPVPHGHLHHRTREAAAAFIREYDAAYNGRLWCRIRIAGKLAACRL